jgi:dihydrofolate reductase
MKKIKVYIAVSLDGFIARPDGGMDLLTEFTNPTPTLTDHGRKELYDSIDTILMGNGTYQEIAFYEMDWPFEDKTSYVLSRYKNNLPPKENTSYITENVIETILLLKQQEGKDIWLVGGAQTIVQLLNLDLIDELQFCYIPVILGKGIPLFSGIMKESKWKLTGSKAFETGILKVDYRLSL